MRRPATQRGLAIITAMLVVAIVVVIAAALGLGQQVWLRQVQNLRDRAQADHMRHAALDWVAILLVREAKDGSTDHLGEAWAKSFPPLPFDGGTISISVSDAQARFNLNNLLRGARLSDPDFQMFQRLLRSQGLDPGLAYAIVDWIDTDGNVSPGGAEDIEYLAQTPSYRAANQPLTSVDELRLVKGFTGAVLETLRPYVTVLPAGTTININTASDVVLAALVPDLSLADAQQIIQARTDKPFSQPSDLLASMPGKNPPPGLYGVKTSYFLVQLGIAFGRWTRSTIALIERPDGARSARVLWHYPDYPKPPREDDDLPAKD